MHINAVLFSKFNSKFKMFYLLIFYNIILQNEIYNCINEQACHRTNVLLKLTRRPTWINSYIFINHNLKYCKKYVKSIDFVFLFEKFNIRSCTNYHNVVILEMIFSFCLYFCFKKRNELIREILFYLSIIE